MSLTSYVILLTVKRLDWTDFDHWWEQPTNVGSRTCVSTISGQQCWEGSSVIERVSYQSESMWYSRTSHGVRVGEADVTNDAARTDCMHVRENKSGSEDYYVKVR